MAGQSWSTWGGTARARPVRVVAPTTVGGIAGAVRAARDEGRQLRPVGSGH